MDDRRFDALVKSLVSGGSRRAVLKGLLGLGGVAITGGALLDDDARAARRPVPTPTPIRCLGNQTPVGGVCACPASAPYQCNPGAGPACCTDVAGGAPLPIHTECCDNACCHGTCYGEELCCPTNNRSTGDFPIPPTHKICDTNAGPECCPYDDDCCLVDGCCSTVCYGETGDADFCCPVEGFCPGGSETDGACCTGNATCCHGGTDERLCVDLTLEGSCCDDRDCGDPCQICNQESHFCGPLCTASTDVCCVDASGAGICTLGECCLTGDDCAEGSVCCESATGNICRTGSSCQPTLCDRCNDAGLDCCLINEQFAGCYDSGLEGACCTADTCEEFNDFANCLVGACTDFQCEQRSECLSTEICCNGDCVAGPKCCDDLGPQECCTIDDCVMPPAGMENLCPHVLECQANGECLWTAGCPAGQSCCDNVCVVGTTCPIDCENLPDGRCCEVADCPPGDLQCLIQCIANVCQYSNCGT